MLDDRAAGDRASARPHFLVVRIAEGGETRAATDRSLEQQTYRSWSRVDVESRRDGLRALPPLEEYLGDEGRLFVMTLADGDTLRHDALERISTSITATTALVTWDSDLHDGSSIIRPQWSPELLLSTDYLGGAVAVAAERLVDAVARLPPGAPWVTWTALLAAEIGASEAAHVPVDLDRQRRRSVEPTAAKEVAEAGLAARGWPASIGELRTPDGDRAGTVLDWQIEAWPRTSIIIPSRHTTSLLGPCLESLRMTTGPTFEVLVVDNGDRTEANERWYDRDWGFPLRVLWWDAPFNFSRVNNRAVEVVDGEVIVLLNDDTVVREPRWLEELVGLASRPGIGCVGMQLLEADGTIQHAGVWLGLEGFAGHLFAGMRPNEATVFGSTSWYRNTLAVTGACLAVRRDRYLEVAGMNESLVLCGSDVVLGLEQYRLGRRNVCSPMAGVAHLGSATRSSAPIGDQILSMELYRPWHDAGDPYLSPRLSLQGPRPAIRAASERSPIELARDRLAGQASGPGRVGRDVGSGPRAAGRRALARMRRLVR